MCSHSQTFWFVVRLLPPLTKYCKWGFGATNCPGTASLRQPSQAWFTSQAYVWVCKGIWGFIRHITSKGPVCVLIILYSNSLYFFPCSFSKWRIKLVLSESITVFYGYYSCILPSFFLETSSIRCFKSVHSKLTFGFETCTPSMKSIGGCVFWVQ